jgi:serine/threonine-protein kinase
MSPVVLGHRYELVREIASGAMGAVYEARDLQLGRVVAVKMLRPELAADGAIRRRFHRESSILRAIEHPAVVRVLDVGKDEDDRAYTVMEFLRGETLESRIAREGRVDPSALGPILLTLADALAAVHAQGVVHGDLKPANVILLDASEPCCARLVDFGLSKVEGLDRLTRTGELAGTPIYMAPELVTGGVEPDARIDLYALGVIAYEALSGATPFALHKHPGQLMFDIVMGKTTPLDVRMPELAKPIADAVMHAIKPSREERPDSATQLRAQWARAWQMSQR